MRSGESLCKYKMVGRFVGITPEVASAPGGRTTNQSIHGYKHVQKDKRQKGKKINILYI